MRFLVYLACSLGLISLSAYGQLTLIDGGFSRVTASSGPQMLSWGTTGAAQNVSIYDNGVSRPSPVAVPPGTTDASSSTRHSLFVGPNGEVLSSGTDVWGERGRGLGGVLPDLNSPTELPTATPQATVFGQGIVGVEAGDFVSYAWTPGGILYGWGLGSEGQFGAGAIDPPTDSPVIVPVPGDVVEVSKKGWIAVARDDQGRAWHWGALPPPGQMITRVRPVTQVPNLSNVTAIETTWTNGYALTANGSLFEWTLANPTPTLVTGVPPLQSIASSTGYVIGLSTTGAVWAITGTVPNAWGWQDYSSNWAPGVNQTITVPRLVPTPTPMTQIAASYLACYVADAQGGLWCWGHLDGYTGLGLGQWTTHATIGSFMHACVPQSVPLAGLAPDLVQQATQCAATPQNARIFPLGLPSLGAEIVIRGGGLPGILLFVAPGALLANPWPALGCNAWLPQAGLANYLALGFGPFSPTPSTSNISGPYWSFTIPNMPILIGQSFSFQAVAVSSAPNSLPYLTNAIGLTIR